MTPDGLPEAGSTTDGLPEAGSRTAQGQAAPVRGSLPLLFLWPTDRPVDGCILSSRFGGAVSQRAESGPAVCRNGSGKPAAQGYGQHDSFSRSPWIILWNFPDYTVIIIGPRASAVPFHPLTGDFASCYGETSSYERASCPWHARWTDAFLAS